MEPPPQHPSPLLFTPLMISMVGIASTALAILLYHVILNKYCLRTRRVISRRSELSEKTSDGVEEKVLDLIPIIVYSSKQGEFFGVDKIECAVCLSEIEEGETVRLLPSCRHAFHVYCIDQWFVSHSNCPVCRSPIVPSMSLELPLQPDLENCIEHEGSGDGNGGSNDNESIEGVRSNRSLCHCISVVLHSEDKSSSLPVRLKRSFSMDHSYISLKLRDNETSSSSSSSKAGHLRSSSFRIGSLMRSYSLLRSNHGGRHDGILPR